MKPRCSVRVSFRAIMGTMSARNTAWDVPDRHEMAIAAEVKRLNLKVKLLPSSRAARRARASRVSKKAVEGALAMLAPVSLRAKTDR